MTEELYFDIELKKCLNTAAFSDDLWDWWYQRLHQAHDASVDRVTDAQRAENAKLRELAQEACELARVFYDCGGTFNDLDDLLCEAAELGVEVNNG